MSSSFERIEDMALMRGAISGCENANQLIQLCDVWASGTVNGPKCDLGVEGLPCIPIVYLGLPAQLISATSTRFHVGDIYNGRTNRARRNHFL